MNNTPKISVMVNNAFMRLGLGMRAKLIILFIIIKVIPLVLLAYLAWQQSWGLGDYLRQRTATLNETVQKSLFQAGKVAIDDAVAALDNRAREDIERMTTDTARRVANFLYERDDDIRFATTLPVESSVYKGFVDNKRGQIVVPGKWVLSEDGDRWILEKLGLDQDVITSSIEENAVSFNYRASDSFTYESRPLFLEMTFIDLNGQEKIKITTAPSMDPALKNVSDRRNTYVKAENYFPELQKLKPGEIYVSDVIGAYVGARVMKMYTPENAAAVGEEFAPEKSAFAGMENPLGVRFKGIIRWATPVVRNGQKIGYVTLALDHDHIMEFTDHLTPTPDRYTELSDASAGNYAFIWDYKGRSIVHPRHFSITGYDPETGDPQIPWLEDRIYDEWKASGKTYAEFIKDVPTFVEQSNSKRPAAELTKAGLVGLDCRYLNFAPQCTGWFDLTRDGGSGSFRILWSGLWKLNTAAAIPYYTGHYGESLRGFGFVAIGAGVDDFHRPAMETKEVIDGIIENTHAELDQIASDTEQGIADSLWNTATSLTLYTVLMVVLVILVAIWIASIFTRKITGMVAGIFTFRQGDRSFRFNAPIKDEMGLLADSFDEMAESIESNVATPLAIIDKDNKIIYMNDAYLSKNGHQLSELVGKDYSDYSMFDEQSAESPITALLNGREAEVMYDPVHDSYYKGTATPFMDKQGEMIGYIISVADVTEIIASQKQIETQRALLNTIFTSFPDLIWYKDKDGRFLAANPRFTELVGKSQDEILGKTVDELNVLHELLAVSRESETEIKRTKAPYHSEEHFAFADGHTETVESVRIPLFDAEGEYRGVLGVSRDITQRVVIENELRDAQEKLKIAIKDANKANESKSAFLASMSHEIRTPMNAIIGMTSIVKRKLNEKNVPIDEIRMHIEQVDTSSQHLLSLLNDILDISKIEAGKIELAHDVFVLATLIDNVASIIKPRCVEKNISFQVRQEGVGSRAFYSDSLRLRQVLINLLGNAVKFTPEKGVVQFVITVKEIKEDKSLIQFKVSDTGIGISEEALQKLFVAFEQGGTQVAREYGGTGLGLSISKSIVSLFGSDIKVSSQEGEGSNFEFAIWLDNAKDVVLPKSKKEMLHAFAGKHALLVDDVRINRVIVIEQLKDTGLIIDEADDGDVAIKKFANSPEGYYDVVFMDVQMPRVNGYEAVRAIRALPRADAANVTIIAMTANAFREDVEEALSNGMNAHLAKPLQLDKLLDMLVKYLNSYNVDN